MRIALITPGFSSDDDDWCIPVLQNLARTLIQSHDIRVLTISYPHRFEAYSVKGVPVQSFGTTGQSPYAYARRMLRAYQYLKAAHARRPFDVLHGFWADQGGLLAALAGRSLRIPVVVTSMAGELTFDPEVRYGRKKQVVAGRLARRGAEGATVLTVGSKFNQEKLRAQQPGLANKVVSLGVDTRLFQRRKSRTDTAGEINLLMVGSLVAVKGHAIAIRAFAKAQRKQSRLRLQIIGDGPLHPDLTSLARDLRVSSYVTFHDHVDHDDLPDFYHAADFCLMTSYFESAAMVILEAASCERVTIGTAVGLLPEITPPEYCVAPGDFNSLAGRILQLCSEPCKIRELGRRAATIVDQDYTLRHMERRFEAVYEEARKKSALSGRQ